MKANKTNRDPIPEHFATPEKAAEFWDTHDLTDYWDLTEEVKTEVEIQDHAITALRGCGDGEGLTEKLLAERREDRRSER